VNTSRDALLPVSSVWVEATQTYEIHVDHKCIPFVPFIAGIKRTEDALATIVALQELYAEGYREGQEALAAEISVYAAGVTK
jgi:hypothetical protein